MKSKLPIGDLIGAGIGLVVGVVCGLFMPVYFAIKEGDLSNAIVPIIVF